MNAKSMKSPSRRHPGPGGEKGAAGIWVLLLGWFFYGAGASLALMSLVELLSPILGLTPHARGALLAAVWAAMWAGYRLCRIGENPSTSLVVAALVLLAAPWGIPLLGPVVGLAQSSILEAPLLLFAMRLLLALLLVLVPLGCLGAALRAPWLGLQRIATDVRTLAHRDAILAAGATVGLVQGGFRLQPWGGATALASTAGLLLLITAGLAGWLQKKGGGQTSQGPGPGREPGFLAWGGRGLWGLSAAAAIVAWCHLLAPVQGPLFETTSRVLAMFLAGVALGALAISLRVPSPSGAGASSSASPLLAGLAGLLVGSSAYLADWLPTLYLSFLPAGGGGTVGFELGQWGLTACLVLPASLIWGLWLPHSSSPRGTGAPPGPPAGHAGDEMGAMLGGVAVAAALFPAWVLPTFGFRATLIGSGSLLVGFSVLGWALGGERARAVRVAGALSGMALTLVPVWLPPPGNIRLLTTGLYRYAPAIHERYDTPGDYLADRLKASIPFYREGGESVVAVEEIPIEDGILLSLTRDGVPIGSSTQDLNAQVLAAEIPLLLRPRAQEVLVIGYGTGVTLGSALLHPLERLHVVETEPAVVEASKQFEPANREPRRDSRLALLAEDPRQVLRSRPAHSLDLILSLGDAPEAARSRFLTTKEFYQVCASRLSLDGLYVQEIPVAGLAPGELASLLKTLRTEFSDVILLQSYYLQLLAIASQEEIRFDLEALQEGMNEPKIASDLARIGILEPGSLIARHRLSGRGFEAFVRPGKVLSDNSRPLAWSGFRPGRPPVSEEVLESIDAYSTGLAQRIEGLEPGEEGDQRLLDLGLETIRMKDAVRTADLAEALLERDRLTQGHYLLGEAHLLRGEQASAVQEWHRALETDPDHLRTLVALARYQVQRQNYEGAEAYLRRAIAAAPQDWTLHYSLGQALFHQKKYEDSEKELAQSLHELGPQKAPLALYYQGLIEKESSHWELSAAFLESYLQWAYDQRRLTAVEADAHLNLAEVYLALGRPQDADDQKKTGDLLTERLKSVAEVQEKLFVESLGSP